MSDKHPNKRSWAALDGVPPAILGLELGLAAGLFTVWAVFVPTMSLPFFAVSG